MIYLLTPTGDRHEAMQMLQRYVFAQTFKDAMHWLIVDDGEVPIVAPKSTWAVKVQHIRMQPALGNTQAANMYAGLSQVHGAATVLVLEDDDVYLPNHVQNVVSALEQHELAGEKVSRYYNITSRRFKSLRNTRHASMASVGVRGGALLTLRSVCERYTAMLDVRLWQEFAGPKILLNTANVIGMKGLPGRKGIGVGHRASFGDLDADGSLLRNWLGPHTAAMYEALV